MVEGQALAHANRPQVRDDGPAATTLDAAALNRKLQSASNPALSGQNQVNQLDSSGQTTAAGPLGKAQPANIDVTPVKQALDSNKRESDATAASRALTGEIYKEVGTSPTIPNKDKESEALARTQAILKGNNDLQAQCILPAIELAYIQDDKGIDAKGQAVNNFTKFATADTCAQKDDKTVSYKDLAAVVDDKSGKFNGVDKAIAADLMHSRFFTSTDLSTSYSREQLLQMVKDSKRGYNEQVRHIPTDGTTQAVVSGELVQQAKPYEKELKELSHGQPFTRESFKKEAQNLNETSLKVQGDSSLSPQDRQTRLADLDRHAQALKIVDVALTKNNDRPLTVEQLLTSSENRVSDAELKSRAAERKSELSTLFKDGQITRAEVDKIKLTAQAKHDEVSNSRDLNREQKKQELAKFVPFTEALNIADQALRQNGDKPVALQQLLGNQATDSASKPEHPVTADACQKELKNLFPDGSITADNLGQLKAKMQQFEEKLKSDSSVTAEQRAQAEKDMTPYLQALLVAEEALQKNGGKPVNLDSLFSKK